MIGISCWGLGGFCMLVEGMFGGNPFPSMSAIFGMLTTAGFVIAVQGMHATGRRFLASMGLALNFLFLLAAFTRVIAWVVR